jgi:hypothetical protein
MHSPKWLTFVGVAALAWNMMGLASAVMDSFGLGPALPPEQAAYAATVPLWAILGTWVAVVAGVVGSAGLIVRKAYAVPAFAASLIGVFLQDLWFMMSNITEVFGMVPVYLQALVLVIAIALLALSVSAKRKGWLR